MNITKDEYKLLKRFYTHKNLIINNETSEILIQKELIEPQKVKVQRSGFFEYSPELVITNTGKLAFEQYREEHLKYWMPIIVSNVIALTSLIVSIIAIML